MVTDDRTCRPMPELPSLLREGLPEVDYKVCCDRLKPDLDNLTGQSWAPTPLTGVCFASIPPADKLGR
jgi:hypothetical protein